MRTVLVAFMVLGVAVAAFFSLDRQYPVRTRIDAMLAPAQTSVLPATEGATAQPSAMPETSVTSKPSAAEVACAHQLAGPASKSCTADSCSDPLAVMRGPCGDFCKALNWRPAETPIAREDCRFKLAWRRWSPGTEEVIGGTDALEHEFQSTVVIWKRSDELCSGVLVSDSIVLTARHCFDKGVAVPQSFVHFGRRQATATEASTARVSLVKTPRRELPHLDLDIALLQLDRPAPEAIRKATLASREMIDATGYVRVVGFGLTEKGRRGDKLYADVLVVSHKCRGSAKGKSDKDFYGCIPDVELVAAELDKDTCRGDSGGPAFVAKAEIHSLPDHQRRDTYRSEMAAGRYFLAGITSRAVATDDVPTRTLTFGGQTAQCGSGGRYVRLSDAALDWIRNTVRVLKGEIAIAP